MARKAGAPKPQIRPLTPERWGDFEKLFGPHGAYGGCWCMWWRLKRSDFSRQQGEGNRRAMRAVVEAGDVPGILGYLEGEPVAWCSVAPREQFASLQRSPVLKPIDDRPVWSIVCFYIARENRGKGLSLAMIRAAVAHARAQGGRIVEAYPTAPRPGTLPPVSSYMGIAQDLLAAGFEEVARPSKSRLILRYRMR